MSNSRALLLDGDKEADFGEICITGPGVGRGYFQNEKLTNEKFVYWQGERMYRTGDFAQRTEYGLEYQGRQDSFVKNRGFLVNLDSQVIPMLSNADGIKAATAFMHKGRLVSFITPESIDASVLRETLSKQYDAFIIPDVIRALEFMPLTPNGKPDNRSLAQLLESENGSSNEGGIDIQNLTGSKLEILKAAVSNTLSVPLSKIQDTSSFWELGGNSLAGLRVLSTIRTKGLRLALRALFDLPSLAAVSDAIEDWEEDPEGDSSLTQNPVNAAGHQIAPLTSLQKKMVQSGYKNPTANYILLKITMPHPGRAPDSDKLREAWSTVMQRHSIFRTAFDQKEGNQEILPTLDIPWSKETVLEDQLEQAIVDRSEEVFRNISAFEQGDLFTALQLHHLITVPDVGSTLLALAHHIHADGWSFALILEEVRAALDGKALVEPPQFTTVARAQERAQNNEKGKAFWSDLLKNQAAQPELKLSRTAAESSVQKPGWTRRVKVDLGLRPADIETAARDLAVSEAALFYTAWGIVLSNYIATDNIVCGAVFSGRNIEVSDADQIVGPFLNTCPFPMDVSDERTIQETLTANYSRLLQMIDYQWSADEAMATISSDDINTMLQTILVMEYDLPSLSGECKAYPEAWTLDREDSMEFGLSVLIEQEDNFLTAKGLFNDSSFGKTAIVTMLEHFRNVLQSLISAKGTTVKVVKDSMLSEQERQRLLPDPLLARPYDGPKTVKDAFEQSASRWPDAVAVESVTGSLTYLALDQASNRLAHHLQSTTKSTETVGVLTDGSLHWITAIISVIKSGRVCCPIDINLPESRKEVIIEQAGVTTLVAANDRCAQAISAKSGRNIISAPAFLESNNEVVSQLETTSQTKGVIYMVFTSGSTGVPKG